MTIANNFPIKLDNVRVWRPFLGGSLIDSLHGFELCEDNHYSEEWIMSIVAAQSGGDKHTKDEGLSKLAKNNNITLKDILLDNPAKYLGNDHAALFEDQLGVLVKLIDASTRLKIQVHPNREKARKFFNCHYGKTECWHILGGRIIDGESPSIYIGFKEGITKAYWMELFEKQDIKGMLDCLHRFETKVGDTFFIPAGIPHAIGAGCFLIEIQEPTDITIRVERGIDDFICHQGIGFDHMFDIFDYEGIRREEAYRRCFVQPEQLQSPQGGNITSLIRYENTPFFKMNVIEVWGSVTMQTNGVFFGMYVMNGEGEILKEGNTELIKQGNQFFVPAATEDFILRNNGGRPMKVYQFFGPKIK